LITKGKMKPLCSLCLILICGFCLATEHQISLQVKRQGTKASVKTNWQTDYGSSNKDTYRQLTVAIEMKNMSRDKDAFIVDWYFLARSLKNNSLKIFDSGGENITLQPMEAKKLLKQSKEIMANVAIYAALGSQEKEGEKVEGYIVTLSDKKGKVFAVAASSFSLEKLANNTEKMNQLIDKIKIDE